MRVLSHIHFNLFFVFYFEQFSGSGTNKIAHAFQRRIESDIQMKYLTLQSKNNDKRRNFIVCVHVIVDFCIEISA